MNWTRPFTMMMLALTLGVAMGSRADADRRPTTIEAFYAPGSPTRVIAHRGFSAIAPENTLVAIEKAIELGADMVEFDVTVTADGEVVVIHDETLGRTTDGRGKVMEKTLEELQRLDAGSWFAPEFAGESIPTLEQVLAPTFSADELHAYEPTVTPWLRAADE